MNCRANRWPHQRRNCSSKFAGTINSAVGKISGGVLAKDSGRRRQRTLRKIKAVGHAVRRRIAGVQRGQTKRHLAKFDQTHMGVKDFGNAPLRSEEHTSELQSPM